MKLFSRTSIVLELLSILKNKGTWSYVKNSIYNFYVLRVRKVSVLKVQSVVTHLPQLQLLTVRH